MYGLRETKTGKTKRFLFPKNVQKAIIDYLGNYEGDRNRPLFISRKTDENGQTRPLSRQMMIDAAKAVGIQDNIGTHTLRKTSGYHAYKARTDLSLLQHIFNHSAPSITLRYIGIIQDDIDNVYISLNL